MTIRGTSTPSYYRTQGEDNVLARVTLSPWDSPLHQPQVSFVTDTGSGMSFLSAYMVRSLGIQEKDTRGSSGGDWAGRQSEILTVSAALWLEHQRPWYWWPWWIQDYSVFWVEFGIAPEIFSDPNGLIAAKAENIVGQDVLTPLRHVGKETMRPAKNVEGMKEILWDHPANVRITPRRKRINGLKGEDFPYDVRPPEVVMEYVEELIHRTRRRLGLE